ncbi:MAG TPA: SDR family NAD(P)-dependent oxidoreductase [Alphaproteobacteria bacterium]|nr:SDR family NAD(P)-dependent oxidoreductase [Alphaproteobacteria bacterium]
MDLADRIAIVTGPAKGMGRSITLALAKAGAHLMLAGRDTDAIEPVVAEVEALGRRVEYVACDVTNEDEVDAMVAATKAAFKGRIDILVNVAGGSGPLGKSFWETTPQEFEDILRLNVTGCFLTMRAVMPVMMAQRYGKIVNIGGTFGLRGRAGRSAYSASKWGLRGISKSAALEAGPYNVNVNNVCPGMVEGPRFERVCTDMARALGISVEAARARHAEEYALRRVSTGDDIADAVLFLASDRARQITGQDLAVDGGWAM